MASREAPSGTLYPVSTVARVFDCSERKVQDLARKGIIPKAKHGQYDLIACVQAYIRHLRSVASGHKSEDGKLDLTEERARLASAQADKTEMENAERRGDLISAPDYRAGAIIIATGIQKRVMAVGAKLQHSLAAATESSVCKRLVDAALREALEDLASLEVAADGGVAGD